MEAGAHYVIIEAREGGKSIGVFDDMGSLKEEMARYLLEEIGPENIMFEAPEKSQQTRLILLFGSDVNLGNIRPDDVIPLEFGKEIYFKLNSSKWNWVLAKGTHIDVFFNHDRIYRKKFIELIEDL